MIEMKFESKLKAKIVCILKTFESWMNAEYSEGNHSLSISNSVSVAVHCCAPTRWITIGLQHRLETQFRHNSYTIHTHSSNKTHLLMSSSTFQNIFIK
jgi:hypothetical protein